MPLFEKNEEHPSYGMIEIHRQSSNKGVNLFGSTIKHKETISIKISKAVKNRDLNRTWFFPRNTVVEIIMSPVQFSEAITSFNTSGVPVTLKFIQGVGQIESCPEEKIREVFENEIHKSIAKVSKKLDGLLKTALELKKQKGGLKAGEKNDLCTRIEMMHQELVSNLPYVFRQFNEQMESSVSEAVAEIDAFITRLVYSLGIEALENELKNKMIDFKSSE